jgi:hypothetical protein
LLEAGRRGGLPYEPCTGLCHSRRELIMNDTVGRPRTLTDAQVRIILDWRARYIASRAVGRRVA